MPLISCRNLSIDYGQNHALENITFEIATGDYLCIVGENGSGKSTLLKGILGLLPCEGEVVFSDGLKKSDVGYLPQQTDIQRDFPATVQEIVLSGFQNKLRDRFFYSARDKQQAHINMERLKVRQYAKKSYRQLSGGQQQRVLLARAMCASSKILIMDEPITGLDPVMTSEFYDLAAELNQAGIAIVMTSHDVQTAVYMAKTILHLDTGVVFYGSAKEYQNSEAFGKLKRG